MAITQKEIDILLLNKKQSVLTACKNDVLELRANGVTFSTIKQWLKDEKNIETSCENIRQFCLRYVNDTNKNQEKSVKSYMDY